MSNMMLLGIVLMILFLLMFGGLWVFAALGIAGLIGIILFGAGWQFSAAIQMWGTSNSFILSAVPLFVFLGEVMLQSGISGSLYRGVMHWVGRIPGGLLHSNVIACALFAAISGSNVATVAAIGSLAIPEQEARHYDRKLILGSIASAGTLGILIPPSISMILYGSWMEVSIARLFIGGVVPGILIAALFMAYIAIRCYLNPQLSPKVSSSWQERIHSFKDIWPSFSLILFIIIGIYTGLMTPTETAAVASVFALLLTVVLRKFSLGLVYQSALNAVSTTAMVMIIVVGAKLFVMFLIFAGVTNALTVLMTSLSLSPMMVLLFIYLIYIVLGCFFDATSLLMVTLPFVGPFAITMGFDLIWFGVIVTVLLTIGHITPPIGMNLFVVVGITRGVTLEEVARSAMPFFFLLLFGLALLTIFPQLVTWLPTTMLDVAPK